MIWRIADDGEHIEWRHDCVERDSGVQMDLVLASLPIGESGWQVEQVEPLTVSPSILCHRCRVHGFIRNGQWLPA